MVQSLPLRLDCVWCQHKKSTRVLRFRRACVRPFSSRARVLHRARAGERDHVVVVIVVVVVVVMMMVVGVLS